MCSDKKYFSKKKVTERRIFNDFLFIDQLRLKNTPKSKYVEMGFSDHIADLLTDKYLDDPTIYAITKTHTMMGAVEGIFDSPRAMQFFSNLLSVQHEEFSKLLKAIALKSSTELLIALFPTQLESRKCVSRLRKDYADYINAEYKLFLERKREMYKEFNPTDSGIELMVLTKQRKPPTLSFLETKYAQNAYKEAVEQNVSGIEIYIQCSEKACVLINQITPLFEKEMASQGELNS